MVMAAQLSGIDSDELNRLQNLLESAGLPTKPPAVGAQVMLDAMGMDKKVLQKKLRFVLLGKLGSAHVSSDVDPFAIGKGSRGRKLMSGLAAYAADEAQSRGRRYEEPAATYRGEYQRDRDRIIHSTAFRRLVYKTQVFVNHEGDLYRTRLTHSLEVSQVGRSVAAALSLNEPLIEAICLAHDLGHTPFGHAGQDELNDCMREFGGFEHNLQSLRVVDELEAKYAEFPGLNLMFETREGILKHCSKANARELGDIGQRFLNREQPGLEAQIANIADAIAYNNHDVDDGIRAGLLSVEQLRDQALFASGYEAVRRRYPDLEDRRTYLRNDPAHDRCCCLGPDRDDAGKH